jgi:hypothetical protein
VQHALEITEEKPNLAIAVVTFNKDNPAWSKNCNGAVSPLQK